MIDKADKFSDKRKQLRRSKLAERDRLDGDERKKKSAAVQRHFFSLLEVDLAGTVMLYLNFRSEVETMPFLEILYRKNINIAVPLTVADPPHIVCFRLDDPDKQLRPGYCGILEPDISVTRKVDPAEIDIVVVPGSVFDLQGGRLGYGGGYYDRFLANKAPQALRVALAFEMQIVERVPVMEHDERMHYIVTESRVLKID